jgi:hypothetical protein
MANDSFSREAVLRAARLPPDWMRRFKASLSISGILVATLFFGLSLTPSLLPRGWVVQGLLSGLCTAVGYGIGVTYRWVWEYLELPLPDRRIQRIALWTAASVCVLVTLGFLWQASAWQNSVRSIVQLEPVDTARPIRVGLLAYVVFAVILGLTRLFHLTHRLFSARLGQGMPRRVANVVGLLIAGVPLLGHRGRGHRPASPPDGRHHLGAHRRADGGGDRRPRGPAADRERRFAGGLARPGSDGAQLRGAEPGREASRRSWVRRRRNPSGSTSG